LHCFVGLLKVHSTLRWKLWTLCAIKFLLCDALPLIFNFSSYLLFVGSYALLLIFAYSGWSLLSNGIKTISRNKYPIAKTTFNRRNEFLFFWECFDLILIPFEMRDSGEYAKLKNIKISNVWRSVNNKNVITHTRPEFFFTFWSGSLIYILNVRLFFEF
jgi:hypothetical protein